MNDKSNCTAQTALTLDEQAGEIRRLHEQGMLAARRTLNDAIRIGELLTAVKAGLPHGQWLPWLEASVPFSERTARNYLRCWNHREKLKTASVADLSTAYYALTPPRELDAPTPMSHAEFYEQHAANMARMRLLAYRLGLPDATLKEIAAIKRECCEMEDYYRRETLMAERELGKCLLAENARFEEEKTKLS